MPDNDCEMYCEVTKDFLKPQPSAIQLLNTRQRVVVYAEEDKLHSQICSLDLSNVQTMWVKKESELIRLASIGFIDMVVFDVGEKSDSQILSTCFEARKVSPNFISFTFANSSGAQASLSQLKYAGAAIIFNDDDSPGTVKDKLYKSLLQTESERLSVLILQEIPKTESEICKILNTKSITSCIASDATHFAGSSELQNPQMIFIESIDSQDFVVEQLRLLRARYKSSPIVVVADQAISKERTIEAGADAFINSPVSSDDLMSCVQMHLKYSFLRKSYASSRCNRLRDSKEFELLLDELLAAARSLDSVVSIASVKLENSNQDESMLTSSLLRENLIELIKKRFRIKDLIAKTESGEILFAFPEEDKMMATQLMMHLKAEVNNYKFNGNNETMRITMNFQTIDSMDNELDAVELIQKVQQTG